MREPGPIDKKEVIVFQNCHGLTPDGRVGNATWGVVMASYFYTQIDASILAPVVVGIFIAALLIPVIT